MNKFAIVFFSLIFTGLLCFSIGITLSNQKEKQETILLAEVDNEGLIQKITILLIDPEKGSTYPYPLPNGNNLIILTSTYELPLKEALEK
ncbi:MAG: hypothetical protein WC325_10610 [Candidatus Bathyarchaeia archaeon]|jgi:hypothetical protein